MQDKRGIFIELINDAMRIGERRLSDESNPTAAEGIANIIRILQKTKDETLNGSLCPSGGATTLGFTREVLDWGEPMDSLLLGAVRKIDRYYRENM